MSDVNVEVWKPVSDFTNYWVSNLGRIKSRIKVLKPFRFKKTEPYLAIDLMFEGLRTRRAVHQIVLEEFVGPRPTEKHEVRHLNGKGDDNRLDNLQWSTKKVNQQDRVKHGTDLRGERSSSAKLFDSEWQELFERFEAGESVHLLAREYGLNFDTIYRKCRKMRTLKGVEYQSKK